MALSRYGGVTGSSKISEDFENINVAFNNIQSEMDANKEVVDDHLTSPSAHAAQDITYSGDAVGSNVKTAIDNTYKRISEIIADGDSNAEVVDARGGYPILSDRLNATDSQLVGIVDDVEELSSNLTKDLDRVYNPLRYGAVGNGTTNDTAAFNSLETVVTGKQIDLGNKTYVVDAIPKKNRYYNGFFKVSGFTRSVILDTPPRFHAFGGQLSKLKKSLGNPLEQFTGIVFVGDSITWGRTLADNGTFEPRTGSLSDPRDKFTSPSFVNEFKRYIGEQYMLGASPILSNWSASTSGEAIAEYTRQTILYPFGGDFTLTTTGTATSIGESQSGASVTGFQKQLVAASTGTGVHTISFNFTGDRFTLCFASTTSTLNYELLVDGVSKGVFSTVPGVDGVISGNNNQREHVFNYVRNKVIQIKTVQPGTSGNNQLRVEGIIINKKVRITNHGIIGATSQSFKVGPMTTSPIAITPYDNYVFCQFGTNDRIISTSRPKGTNTFSINLKALIDSLTPLSDVILMSANPAKDESPVTFSFTMQDVRNIIYNLAKENNIDMIDNYSAWSGIDPLALSDDGLHPNAIGHQVYVRNIINSLESC